MSRLSEASHQSLTCLAIDSSASVAPLALARTTGGKHAFYAGRRAFDLETSASWKGPRALSVTLPTSKTVTTIKTRNAAFALSDAPTVHGHMASRSVSPRLRTIFLNHHSDPQCTRCSVGRPTSGEGCITTSTTGSSPNGRTNSTHLGMQTIFSCWRGRGKWGTCRSCMRIQTWIRAFDLPA